jgi:lipid-binding SYLF domain-containing protein
MMIGLYRPMVMALGVAALAAVATLPSPVLAASADEIDRGVNAALRNLYASQPSARVLAAKAKAVLVFPTIVKAGFMFGGQIGEGAMRKGDLLRGGRTTGYYNSVAASYGLQAGVQTFSYALFFMNDGALAALDNTAGFELGVGPSIVLVDQGLAKSMTTTTLTQDVYAFIFGQKGLMAGLGIQGSKITRLDK